MTCHLCSVTVEDGIPRHPYRHLFSHCSLSNA